MGWRNTPDGELFCICNEFSCRFLLFICKLSFVEMKHMLGKKLKILLAVGAASAVMLAAGCGGGDVERPAVPPVRADEHEDAPAQQCSFPSSSGHHDL